MLDTDTKRRIDTARDILVGKVPDPKSQVEQITIALIYKFMDDMDAEAEELGGHRKFFAGEFARYGWAKLMRSGLGGHETLNLYAEGITKMPENPGIPHLFRDIFKNAYLPYRDPETLRSFLKVIDEFTYDHSERLGDAFEYLLSVLGSQGDAGQFRTPRHIIDFIVSIIDPQKHETVLDPACGTAGFLISSYKHILKANTNPKGQSILTPDERGRLAQNFKGYDISPDMVRLSLVNLYLHGFTDPHIFEYDTLTQQERWAEYADVILANPPFMSPKGGIKPHRRFSIQAKRSEVLFVDYMAEHLTPTGRAGIIVPEGIIFQSQGAYRDLRKMLVENSLVAVVSLPAGVFQPYSGVKTSVLILDKSLARQTNTIAFFKVENDGFALGAQRREIDKNDLPQVQSELAEYLRRLRARESVEEFQPTLGLVTPKAKIAENGDYNLSGERYRETGQREAKFPHVKLSEIADIAAGNPAPQGETYFAGGTFPFVRTSDVGQVHLSSAFSGSVDKVNKQAINQLGLRLFPAGTILFPKSGASTFLNHRVILSSPAYVSSHLACIICDESKALPNFVYQLLCQIDAKNITPDQAYPSLRLTEIGNIEIPIPPLGVQREIVEEIEGYQKVIDGARAVLDNYRPHISIHPDWPMEQLGKLCSIRTGKKDVNSGNPEGLYPFFTCARQHTYSDVWSFDCEAILVAGNGDVGACQYYIGKFEAYQRTYVLSDWAGVTGRYLFFCLDGPLKESVSKQKQGNTMPYIKLGMLSEFEVPVPPLDIQHRIVNELEGEQALVNGNRELIERMEKKIQATLARVWGEEPGENNSEEA